MLDLTTSDLKGSDFLNQIRTRGGASSPTGSDGSGSGSDASDEGPGEAFKYQGRRRSRAVLYTLSGQFDRHKSTKSKLQLNKVNKPTN